MNIEHILITAHVVNIIFCGSLGILLQMKHPLVEKNFGWDSPARQMFAGIYLTIAITSLFAVLVRSFIADVALILFPVQILYSIISLITVTQKRNAVLWINFCIAIFLAFAFMSLFNVSMFSIG